MFIVDVKANIQMCSQSFTLAILEDGRPTPGRRVCSRRRTTNIMPIAASPLKSPPREACILCSIVNHTEIQL